MNKNTLIGCCYAFAVVGIILALYTLTVEVDWITKLAHILIFITCGLFSFVMIFLAKELKKEEQEKKELGEKDE